MFTSDHIAVMNPRRGPSAIKASGWTRPLAKLIRLCRAWRDYERTRRELSGLDDRELHEIGICRGDIRAVAWGAKSR